VSFNFPNAPILAARQEALRDVFVMRLDALLQALSLRAVRPGNIAVLRHREPIKSALTLFLSYQSNVAPYPSQTDHQQV
jgi:hypothetical protein